MTIWSGYPLGVLNEDCITFTVSKKLKLQNFYIFLYHLNKLNGCIKKTYPKNLEIFFDRYRQSKNKILAKN